MTTSIRTSSPNIHTSETLWGAKIWQDLIGKFTDNFPPSRFAGVKILLGVSGGADSIAMLRMVHQLWTNSVANDLSHVIVAHFNHQLRGRASDDDEAFVADLAATLGLEFKVGRASATSQSSSIDAEAALRKARYDFFESIAHATGARYVAVAHTAEDNVETVLHHLFRGTGSAGLAGMARHRSLGADLVLIRPMLEMHRKSLREALRHLSQPWREDASNQDSRYQRNWIRNELIPLIRTRYPQPEEAIGRVIRNQSMQHDWLVDQAASWTSRHVAISSAWIVIQKSDVALPVLAIAIAKLWDSLGWPRQGIASEHIDALHQAVSNARHDSFTMPGDVQVTIDSATVSFHRGRTRRP